MDIVAPPRSSGQPKPNASVSTRARRTIEQLELTDFAQHLRQFARITISVGCCGNAWIERHRSQQSRTCDRRGLGNARLDQQDTGRIANVVIARDQPRQRNGIRSGTNGAL